MPFVSVLGWTILAVSLESDHPDFLGWLRDGPFWLTNSFAVNKRQRWILAISSAYNELGLAHWVTRNFSSVPTL